MGMQPFLRPETFRKKDPFKGYKFQNPFMGQPRQDPFTSFKSPFMGQPRQDPFTPYKRYFGRRKKKVSKKKSPSAALKKLCKSLKVKLTTKRAGKRVYKSEKVLKAQCKKASKKSSFGKKKKRRRRKRTSK